jgi:hypothetical protein
LTPNELLMEGLLLLSLVLPAPWEERHFASQLARLAGDADFAALSSTAYSRGFRDGALP